MDILFIVERATYKSWLPVISLGGIATKIILASLDHHLKHIVPMILNILEDAHDLTSSIKGIYGILIDTLLLFDFIGLYSHTRRIMRSWSKANRDVSTKSFCEFTAIRQKGKSQNGCYKKIKRAKSTCAYQGGGGGREMFVSQKLWHALFSCNTRFEMRPFTFTLLPTNLQNSS